MIDRINRYYQFPVSRRLHRHFREDIGLEGTYRKIFDDLRLVRTDTQGHADNVGLPLKRYNEMAAVVGQHCINELIRLAEKGLELELSQPE